ncbi:MAG: phosphopyruvate hydratase [Nitrososphaerales archaeon]|nr:phosphopyruvate hydratase [Nitrososphaerales archaeon]
MPPPRGRIALIRSVTAREILDSRGNPTVEAEVTADTAWGRASVPSGASTGSTEALELRDGDKRRFHGKGVKKAVSNVNKIIGPRLKGLDCSDQRRIDDLLIGLDGTPNKERLGANAILAVSMATSKAAARAHGRNLYEELREARKYRLPVPMMNVINGGEHAGNKLAIQEFLIEPVGGRSCREAVRMGAEVYQSLKGILVKRYGREAINVGDEGGFAPSLSKTRDALDSIAVAIKDAGYGEKEVRIGMDAAASVFYDPKKRLYTLDGRSVDADRLEDLYAALRDEYSLLTLEDPFNEDAFGWFASITKRLGSGTKVIGDDLYTTNVTRMTEGIRKNATNGILIKLNQIGTVSETEDAIDLARDCGWVVAVSHRSGETEDPFIAHLATAFGSEFIKAGAPARGERVAKYNELIRIGEKLGSRASFAGRLYVT